MPVQLSYPGVYIEELPSGVRTIAGVATSIAAFVGRAWRGPVDEPVTLYSYADYERQFGGLWRDSTMSYAVQQFFQNGGGQAIVVRVVTLTPGSEAEAATFSLTSGEIFSAASPGTWGMNLQLTVDHATKDPTDLALFNLTIFDDPDSGLTQRAGAAAGCGRYFATYRWIRQIRALLLPCLSSNPACCAWPADCCSLPLPRRPPPPLLARPATAARSAMRRS